MVRKKARLTVIGVFGAFTAWGIMGTRTEAARTSPVSEPAAPQPVAEPARTLPAEPTPAARPAEPARPSPVVAPASVRAPAPPARPSRTREARRGPPRRVAIRTPGEGTTKTRIDAHEVSVARFRACVQAGACNAEQFLAEGKLPCNYGVDGRDDHPMNCVDWLGAKAFCEFDGGRLCKPDEWFAACRGPDDWDFPYGAAFQADACFAQAGAHGISSGTEPTGNRDTCQSGTSGVYDMAGNVSEWVDECKDTYCHMYGGAFVTNEPVDMFASCKRVCAGNQKTFRSATIGIRCCYDAETH